MKNAVLVLWLMSAVAALVDYPWRLYQIVAVDLPEVPGGEPMPADKPVPPSRAPAQLPPWLHYDYAESRSK
jgi:hypothetical protein